MKFHFSVYFVPLRSLSRVASDYSSDSVVCLGSSVAFAWDKDNQRFCFSRGERKERRDLLPFLFHAGAGVVVNFVTTRVRREFCPPPPPSGTLSEAKRRRGVDGFRYRSSRDHWWHWCGWFSQIAVCINYLCQSVLSVSSVRNFSCLYLYLGKIYYLCLLNSVATAVVWGRTLPKKVLLKLSSTFKLRNFDNGTKMMAIAPHRWYVQPLLATYITFGVGYCFIRSKGSAKTWMWDKANKFPHLYFILIRRPNGGSREAERIIWKSYFLWCSSWHPWCLCLVLVRRMRFMCLRK